jgi:hypothetical protein
MQLQSDVAQLALVAYANVVGATGLSPAINSGVVTTRTDAGQYTITLPGGTTPGGLLVPGPAEGIANSMGAVTLRGTGPTPVTLTYDDTDPLNKKVIAYSSATQTFADVDFSVEIFRSTKFPAAGGPV